MSGTVTFSWDGKYPFAWKPGKHVNVWTTRRPPARARKHLRSIRLWWLWFAVAYYRMDDYQLVAEKHGWSED